MAVNTADMSDITDNTARFSWRDGKNLLLLSAVLLISFLTFLPSLQNGFVNWDDQINVYQNPNLTRISDWGTFVDSVATIFTSDVMGNYNPLPIFSFAIESALYGLDNPEWMHLGNILLHLFCVYLVFRIGMALGLNPLAAAFCSLLFGIHPLRVESVAWITERKDVLLGCFYFLALFFYLKRVKTVEQKGYSWQILLCFILALLSKIQAVALPLSMLLIDYYAGRKLELKLIVEKWLYFSLSLITGIVGILFLRADGGIQNNNLFPFTERIFIGAYSYCVYLVKSILPYEMVPVYPYPAALDWLFYVCLILIAALAGLGIYLYRTEKKVPLFGLLFFTVNIMFLLQVVGAGQGFLADRFTYIPYFGLFFTYAWGFQWLSKTYGAYAKLISAVAIILCAGFAYLSFEQNKIWQDGETLWSHVLEHFPATSLAWENRASYYEEQGKTEAAYRDYSRAITLKPTSPSAYFSRGTLYLRTTDQQQLLSALQDLSMAIKLSPGTSSYLVNRGIVLSQLDRLDAALQDFNTAEKHSPGRTDIYLYRSKIFFKLGQYAQAQADLERYLELNPKDASMWSNLGTVARLNGRFADSVRAFDRALRIDPGNLEYHYKRAITYYEMGDLEQASKEVNQLKSRGFQGIHPEFENLLHQPN